MWGYRLDATLAPTVAVNVRDRAACVGDAVNPKVQELLRFLEEPSALHFDDMLLPDEDPLVLEHQRLEHALAQRRTKRKMGAKRDVKLTWEQKYTLHRAKLDYQQERPYTSERGARWKALLTDRTLELLDLKCLDVMNEQGVDPREVSMLWDLAQSVERVPGTRLRRDRQNYAACILPTPLWHTARRRFLLGREKLALQGILSEDLKNLDNFPQALLGDLAGNAFTSTVCLANLVCAAVFSCEVNAASHAGGI